MCERHVIVFSFVAVVVAFVGPAEARLAPDFIHPCNNTDSACLVKATQDAIPEFSRGLPDLGVPSLDPFIIEELPIQLPGVKVTFLDGKVTGLRKCQVLNVEAYLEKNIFMLEIRCNITIRGKYTAVGRLLLFPINGEGDSKIKIVNSIIKLNIKTKYFKDTEGRDHFGIKNYRYTFDYGDRVHYTINNLFKGNPELSNTVLQFLNENWRVVTEEFGQPVVDYAMNVTIDTAKKFFSAVPYDELLYVPIPKASFIIALCFLICFCSVGYAKLAPDFIHPCNATTKECLVKSTQDAIPEFVNGIPNLGIPSLDPFVIEKLAIPLNGLKVTFYQGKVTGFRKCIVDNVISELEKRHFVLEFHCNLTIKGQYDAVGKILLFPINGEGNAKVKLVNLRMKLDFNTKYIKDNKGVNHFAIKNYKYTFDYGDRVIFDLENLFKESKELSASVLAFMNENWKTVAEEFGKPIVDYAVDLAVRTVEKFFLVVPYEELINIPIPQ